MLQAASIASILADSQARTSCGQPQGGLRHGSLVEMDVTASYCYCGENRGDMKGPTQSKVLISYEFVLQ